MKRKFFLDYNETLNVSMEVGAPNENGERVLTADFDFSALFNADGTINPHSQKLLSQLLDHLQIQSGDEVFDAAMLKDAFQSSQAEQPGHARVQMNAAVHPGTDRVRDVMVSYAEAEAEPATLVSWRLSDKEPEAPAPYDTYPLTVTEMRQLANQDRTGARDIPHQGREAMARLQKADADLRPKTDLHSHMSSQIKPKRLLDIAIAQDIKAAGDGKTYNKKAVYYPLDMLSWMGVDISRIPQEVICEDVPPVKFSPIGDLAKEVEKAPIYKDDVLQNPCRGVRISALDTDALKDIRNRIEQQITIPSTEIVDFGHVEMEVYRYANFLTKNPNLVEPMILEVARDYAEQGVFYTEQAVTDATNPAWLEKALPAIEKAKAETGVDMRILAGIPRSLPPEVMMQKIEEVKALGDCPYIAGVDFLGYEMNKTKNFDWALNRLAEWASTHRRDADKMVDFVIRVHAGENGKNEDNVLDAMKAALKYDVPIRIGHGVHFGQAQDGEIPGEFTDLAQQLGKTGLLAVEFNMDSNIALHNIDTLRDDVPWREWEKHDVPYVLSSDGAGIYQTDVTQITAAALASGMGEQQLEAVRNFENQYVHRQQQFFEQKKQSAEENGLNVENYHATYAARMPKDKDALSAVISGTQDLAGKTPILLAGAGGSSWRSMSPDERIEAIVLIEMLARVVNPEQAYFISGRSKNSGVAHALDITYEHMQEEAKAKEAATGEKVELNLPAFKAILSNAGTPSLPKHLTHFEWVNADFSQLSKKMIEKVNANPERPGYGVFIHGSDFTRSFIMHADQKEMGFALMTGVGGASANKAQVIMGDEQRTDLGLDARGVVVQSKPVNMIERMMQTDQLKDAFKEEFRSPEALKELETRIRQEVKTRNAPPEFQPRYSRARAQNNPDVTVGEAGLMGALQEAMSGKISL